MEDQEWISIEDENGTRDYMIQQALTLEYGGIDWDYFVLIPEESINNGEDECDNLVIARFLPVEDCIEFLDDPNEIRYVFERIRT